MTRARGKGSRGPGRSSERPARAEAGKRGVGEPFEDPGSTWRPGALATVVIAIVLLCCLYPRHSWQTYRNVNEQARLYLVKAVVEEGVLNIDNGIKTYGDLQDKATRDGHIYCDKPIGLSVISVPIYWVLYHAGRIMGFTWSLQAMRYALTIFCVTLPTIGLLLLADRYWRLLGAPAWLAALALVAYGLGTIAFTYSTQYLGHQLAAVLAFAHFAISRDFDAEVPAWKLAAAGALAGLGAITDYFSALIHVIIIASYITKIRPLRSWGAFLAAGAAAFAPLPLYNYFAFGSPARMSYGQEALPVFKELHGTGFFGVTFPRLESFTGLLFSPAKGLFWLSPFLVLGIVGIVAAVRDRRRRRDGIVLAVSIAAILWLAMSVHDWRAGWTVGPRHMVSMLPLLTTGVVLAILYYPRLAGALVVAAALSMGLVFLPTMTLPAFDVNFVTPITSQALFLAKRGLVSPNPGISLGLSGAQSLVLPALLAAIALGLVLFHAFRARARIGIISAVVAAVVLAGAAWIIGTSYPPLPRPMEIFFQAHLFKLLDQPTLAASMYEAAVVFVPDPAFRRQVADHAFPEAALIYSDLGDVVGMQRVAGDWARIDPGNPKIPALNQELSRMRKQAK